ncbi:hypothetical protein ACET6V_15285 [Aeromonas caviae]|uniref:hypothetical protein n=1 Tax=Aeromonas caviae TaxID=648 RepID=UPI00330560DF
MIQYLLAVFCIFTLNPYFSWWSSYPYYILSILLFIVMVNELYRRKMSLNGFILFFICVGGGVFYSLLNLTTPHYIGVAFIVFLFVTIINDKTLIVNTYLSFRTIYSWLVIFSVPLYIYILFGGKPLGIISPQNIIKADIGNYDNYLLLIVFDNQYFSLSKFVFHRLHLIFDEPGVVGTISAMLLYSSIICGCRDWKNATFLLSGFLSFSLAFYFLMFVFVFLYIVTNFVKSYKLVIISAVLFLPLIYSISLGVDAPHLKRFNVANISESNNRYSNEITNEINELCSNDLMECFFGSGENHAKTIDPAGSSAIYDIIDYGYFFILYVIVFYAIYIYMLNGKNNFLPSCLLFLLYIINLYQRPFYFTPLIFVVLLGPVVLAAHKNSKKKSEIIY